MTVLTIHLVIEKSLNVVDGQQMLAIHGNDDGVPNLGYEDLIQCENHLILRNVHLTLGLYLTSISAVANILA